MTIDQIEQLSDAELRKLSVKRNCRGCFTKDANLAYLVRQKRANASGNIGADIQKPSLYRDDYQYYGSVGWGNR